MKKEKVEKAQKMDRDIKEKRDLLENVKKLLIHNEDDIPNGMVKVRVRGTVFLLPKKIFEAELVKKIKNDEKEINKLTTELDAL